MYYVIDIGLGSLNTATFCLKGYPLYLIPTWLDIIADELAELANYATKAEGTRIYVRFVHCTLEGYFKHDKQCHIFPWLSEVRC